MEKQRRKLLLRLRIVRVIWRRVVSISVVSNRMPHVALLRHMLFQHAFESSDRVSVTATV